MFNSISLYLHYNVQSTSFHVSDSGFSSEKVELLNIGDLQLDNSKGTLQASPITVGDTKKELEALNEDLNLKTFF